MKKLTAAIIPTVVAIVLLVIDGLLMGWKVAGIILLLAAWFVFCYTVVDKASRKLRGWIKK